MGNPEVGKVKLVQLQGSAEHQGKLVGGRYDVFVWVQPASGRGEWHRVGEVYSELLAAKVGPNGQPRFGRQRAAWFAASVHEGFKLQQHVSRETAVDALVSLDAAAWAE